MENKEKNIPAFFAENGITATSANHLSNIAKENYMAIEKQMASLEFYRTTVNFFHRFGRRNRTFIRHFAGDVCPYRRLGQRDNSLQKSDSVFA